MTTKIQPTTLAPTSILENNCSIKNTELENKYQHIHNSLEKVIGKPYYSKNGFIIYNMDNLDFMKKLKESDLKFDLIVTSPPYNIGKEYENIVKTEDYVQWCSLWLDEIYNISSDNASFWLNLGYLDIENKAKAIPISYLLWDKIKFFLIQEVVWNYGAGVSAKKYFAPRNEKFLFYVKNESNYVFNLDLVRDKNVKYPNQKKNGKLRCNPLGKNPTDVWEFPKVTSGSKRSSKERTAHPAQFPLSVIDRIVKVSSNDYDLVFDPFSGSGTTGIAAHGNYKIYVGTEIKKEYCDLTIERFENYLKEKQTSIGKLF